ncbi:hypothetical protein jhhlp_005370 [Lomentospora prolificans]|uniref:ABC transporter domain-containing protein n=1 Tax=Lomentospora prolificans TaxID=41688 RepID=A0A2N3N6N4_9PEZI|nr:hypothetical protein jhhlp_005370 [Lomentospora prolificans]
MDSASLFSLLSISLALPVALYGPSMRTKAKKAFQSSDQVRDVKILIRYLWPQGLEETHEILNLLIQIVLFVVARQVTTNIAPLLLRHILSKMPEAHGVEREGKFPIFEVATYILLRHVAGGMLGYFKWDRTWRLQARLSDRITIASYDKLLSLSADYHDGKNSGTVWMTIRGSGKGVVRMFTSLAFDFVPSIIDAAVGIASFKTLGSTRAAVLTVVVIVVYVVAILWTSDRKSSVEGRAEKTRRRRDLLGSDAILNWWTIFCFNRLDYEAERHATNVQGVRDADMSYVRERALSHHIKQLVSNFGLLLVCLLVGYDIWNTPGRSGSDLVILMGFWQQVFGPVHEVLNWKDKISSFFIDTRKLLDILQEENNVKDIEGAKPLNFKDGTIEFKDVSFAYTEKGKPALDNISFTIEGGKTLAFVGQTGGGKSTTLKLLMRAYDPTSGSILVDGQDIRKVRKKSLMDHIGIVPQTIGVFNATILDNLRYGKLDATLEECQEACRAVCLHDKIMSFENGYDEMVGERGLKLSGGELQRLATARLLLRNPEIALFDEAMSSLDSGTEAKIQEYLQTWGVGRTVIVVAHRLVTIVHADVIMAVKDGKVVERGTHKELLAKGGYYHELWYKQHPFSG